MPVLDLVHTSPWFGTRWLVEGVMMEVAYVDPLPEDFLIVMATTNSEVFRTVTCVASVLLSEGIERRFRYVGYGYTFEGLVPEAEITLTSVSRHTSYTVAGYYVRHLTGTHIFLSRSRAPSMSTRYSWLEFLNVWDGASVLIPVDERVELATKEELAEPPYLSIWEKL